MHTNHWSSSICWIGKPSRWFHDCRSLFTLSSNKYSSIIRRLSKRKHFPYWIPLLNCSPFCWIQVDYLIFVFINSSDVSAIRQYLSLLYGCTSVISALSPSSLKAVSSNDLSLFFITASNLWIKYECILRSGFRLLGRLLLLERNRWDTFISLFESLNTLSCAILPQEYISEDKQLDVVELHGEVKVNFHLDSLLM